MLFYLKKKVAVLPFYLTLTNPWEIWLHCVPNILCGFQHQEARYLLKSITNISQVVARTLKAIHISVHIIKKSTTRNVALHCNIKKTTLRHLSCKFNLPLVINIMQLQKHSNSHFSKH